MVKIKKTNEQKLEDDKNEVSNDLPPPTRFSDDPPLKKPKWINRQRVLVFCNSLLSARDRFFMKDLVISMPHSREDFKLRNVNAANINEMCSARNCNKAMFVEAKQCLGLYLWLSCPPDGPSVYFAVQNIVTMFELNLPGNCLRGSRPLLSFDENFSIKPHLKLIKEIFIQVFGVPHHLPKSQPFTDRVITFTYLDNRIWYRQYQILKEDGALAEIGPRFVLFPIKILSGSFGGELLWKNYKFIKPITVRAQMKNSRKTDFVQSQMEAVEKEANRPKDTYSKLPNYDIFKGNTLEVAANICKGEIPKALKELEAKNKPLIDFRSSKQIKEVEMKKEFNAKKIASGNYLWTITEDSSQMCTDPTTDKDQSMGEDQSIGEDPTTDNDQSIGEDPATDNDQSMGEDPATDKDQSMDEDPSADATDEDSMDEDESSDEDSSKDEY